MPFVEIHFKGRMDVDWSDWFQGFTVRSVSADENSLSGEVADNAAMYGILSSLSSLRLTLISVSVTEETD